MPRTVNEKLYDLAVSHQIGITRLATATLRRLIALVDRCEQSVLAELREAATELGAARLERLLAGLRTIYADSYAELASRLEADCADLAQYEADWTERSVLGALPVGVEIEFVVPSLRQLRSAIHSRPFQGRVLSEWGQDLGEGAFGRVRDAIRQGVAEGQTTDDVVRRIRGTRAAKFRDGITQISRRGCESLVRTATCHVANHAREQTMEANRDVVGSVRWVSTLDSRTTPICRSRDGQTFPVGSGPRPPAHWGCRSTTVPIVRSWAELGLDLPELPAGTRASVDGQVPATETYQTWLARQSATTQDDVLGPSRGRLFREGGYTVDRFTDPTGRQYTLAQLRSRDAEARRVLGD